MSESKRRTQAYDKLKRQYESMLSILIAIVRAQGDVQVERALVEDQNHEWTIATEPRADGSGLTVRALHKGAATVIQ